MTAFQLTRFILAIPGDFVDSFLLGIGPTTNPTDDPEVASEPAITLLLLLQPQLSIHK